MNYYIFCNFSSIEIVTNEDGVQVEPMQQERLVQEPMQDEINNEPQDDPPNEERREETDTGLTCSDCGKVYKNKKVLQVHQNYKHNKNKIRPECHICHTKFSCNASVSRHINEVHNMLKRENKK